MKFIFLGFSVEFVFVKVLEHLSDMLSVGSLILGVNEDIVQVDYDANI